MGKKGKKKDKKKKKGKGMEKTMAKLKKKESRRSKGRGGGGSDDEEEDIDAILASFKEKDRKRNEVKTEPLQRPSARIHGSFTPHPTDPNKLIMFGGEYFDGKKDRTFGDLLIYNRTNNKWSKVTAPRAPLPRLAHQAVGLAQRGGELWMFGGHFNSPKQGFRHQNELWVLHLKDMRWERVESKGAPSPRSGHRMVAIPGGKLVVFGGYFDSRKSCLYYNDLFVFDTETRKWTEYPPPARAAANAWPSERSGCSMAVWNRRTGEGSEESTVVLYGGMRVENKGKFSDVGVTETDLWSLTFPGSGTQPLWRRVEAPGRVLPRPRLGMGVAIHRDQMVFFGGVEDVETRWDLKSTHFADLWFYNLKSRRADRIRLKSDVDQPQPPKPPSISKVDVGHERATVYFQGADGMGQPILSYTVVARPTGEKVHGSASPITVSGLQNGQKYTFLVTATNGAGKGEPSAPSAQVTPTALRVTSLAPTRPPVSGADLADEAQAAAAPDAEDKAIGDGKASADGKESSQGKTLAKTKPRKTNPAYGKDGEVLAPTPRHASMVCLAQDGRSMYVFGGTFEAKAREYMFSDLYKLDLDKREKWEVVYPINTKDQVWYGSDDDDETDDESEDEDDEDAADGKQTRDPEVLDEAYAEKPAPGETLGDFFTRTKDVWMKRAAAEAGEGVSEKAMRKNAFALARQAAQASE